MVNRVITTDEPRTEEHGVGSGKKQCLVPELSENAGEVMKTVRRALDPDTILNPGKIIGTEYGGYL